MLLKRLFILCFLCFSITGLAAKKLAKPSARAVEHNNLGVTALYSGQIERAEFEFKTAVELQPRYAEAVSNLGLAYKHQGRLKEAEATLLFAITCDKKFATPYNHLGLVYFDQQKFSEALAQFKLAKKYNKKFSDAWYNAGLVYLSMFSKNKKSETLALAANEFKEATTLNNDHAYAHLRLADIYREQNKIEEAILRYRLAIEVDSQLTMAWNALASLYTQTGQTDKAEEALNRALETGGDSAETHIKLGLNHLRDKNFVQAIDEFNRAIALKPTLDEAYFNIGYSYFLYANELLSKGQKSMASDLLKESNKAYQSAINIRPTSIEAYLNSAKNALLLNQKNEAVLMYCQFIKLAPNHAHVPNAKIFIQQNGACP